MNLQTHPRDDFLLVEVAEDRIDAAVAIQFKEAMRRILSTARPADGGRRVMLDLGRVTFLDSSGLGAVVAVMKLLAPGDRLELAALTPPVERVFRLTRMDSVFALHPAVPDARPD